MSHSESEKIRARVHILENSNAANMIRIKDLEDTVKAHTAKLEEVVKWKHFVWIVGVIFMFMTVILSGIWFQINVVRENIDDFMAISTGNQASISRIEGILNSADVVYE